MPRNYACRTDANQTAIVEALRGPGGCFVQSLSSVGCGCPDLLAIRSGVAYLLEVKDGEKSPCKRDLTDAERKWQGIAKRYGYTVAVVCDAGQALRAVGVETSKGGSDARA